jgi:hypothetical protein
MVFIKTFAKKLLVLAIIFKLLFHFFGYECTMFWLQAFTSFCLNQILSLFGSRLDFSETPPLLQWELITLEEFLRHLKQTYRCLSEVNSFEDLVTLEKTLDFGMVYAPTKAGTIIILFFIITWVFCMAWSAIQGEYPGVLLVYIFFWLWLSVEELGFGLGCSLVFTAFLVSLLFRGIIYLLYQKKKGGVK